MVAGHCMEITLEDELAATLSNYHPFSIEDNTDPVFRLTVKESDDISIDIKEEWRQKEDGQEIISGQTDSKNSFVFRWYDKTAGHLVCGKDYKENVLTLCGFRQKAAIDNSLMVLYALTTATKGTLLFHASTVSYNNKAYMFLGPSGTGKSTHSRLWIEYIHNTELINDDNPVVRLFDNGIVKVYGSPWSGKTPCYRRVEYELGGIVGLSQAPCNAISRIKGIKAYSLLATSVSGKTWEKRIADGLHHTLNTLASQSPIWHLDCLPNKGAAILCNSTIR